MAEEREHDSHSLAGARCLAGMSPDPRGSSSMAGSVGFEPTVPCGTQVFKTSSFGHSDNCPYECVPRRQGSNLNWRVGIFRSRTCPHCLRSDTHYADSRGPDPQTLRLVQLSKLSSTPAEITIHTRVLYARRASALPDGGERANRTPYLAVRDAFQAFPFTSRGHSPCARDGARANSTVNLSTT